MVSENSGVWYVLHLTMGENTMYYSIVLSGVAVMVMVAIVGTGLGPRRFASVRGWARRRMMVVAIVVILRCFTSMRRWVIVRMVRSRIIFRSGPRRWKGFRVIR